VWKYLNCYFMSSAPTQNRLPDFRLQTSAKTYSARPHHRRYHILFELLTTRVATVRTGLQFSDRTNGALVQTTLTCIRYYIMGWMQMDGCAYTDFIFAEIVLRKRCESIRSESQQGRLATWQLRPLLNASRWVRYPNIRWGSNPWTINSSLIIHKLVTYCI
jgi:hypothetical protein